MGSGKPKRRPKMSSTNPNRIPLGPNRTKTKRKKENKNQKNSEEESKAAAAVDTSRRLSGNAPAYLQLSFFLDRFQSACVFKFSSLELEAIKDTCILGLSKDLDKDAGSLGKHMMAAFGKSWKEVLCEGQLVEGNIDPGCPAVLVVSSSALRSLELLRGLRPLTRECRAVKLFSKHMKVDDQVSLLKSRVNIASGTPSRIKKLIDIDALGLSRLDVIVLDMHTDAKGYSLLTLPQVSDEFWDLYKSHFHQRLIDGNLRICLYGPIPIGTDKNVAQDE